MFISRRKKKKISMSQNVNKIVAINGNLNESWMTKEKKVRERKMSTMKTRDREKEKEKMKKIRKIRKKREKGKKGYISITNSGIK